jgi:hypothetical protein
MAERRRERVKRRPLAAYRRPALRGANGSAGNGRPDDRLRDAQSRIARWRSQWTKQKRSRGALRPSFAPRKRKAPDPIASAGAGGGTGIHLDRTRLIDQEGETPTDA